MPATNHTLVVEKDASCRLLCRVYQTVNGVKTPVNLTGYSSVAQARATEQTSATFINATTDNGQIVITDAVNGEIMLEIPPSVTSDIAVEDGVWDWKIVPGGGPDDATYIARGKVRVVIGVAR